MDRVLEQRVEVVQFDAASHVPGERPDLRHPHTDELVTLGVPARKRLQIESFRHRVIGVAEAAQPLDEFVR